MFCRQVSVFSVLLLSVLVAVPLTGHKTPLPSTWGDVRVKHKWNAIPNYWVSLGHPPNDTTIDLYIALKSNSENALIDALYEVSHPRHPKYGAHLSMEQVAELVAPHPDTLELVKAWLEYNGVPPSTVSTTLGGGWLTATGVPVSQANQLLGASYQQYYHAGTNDTILRTIGYELPAALHAHVQTVVPTTAFTSSHPLQQTLRSRPGGSAMAQAENATSGAPVNMTMLPRREPSSYTTPWTLRSMYNTETYVPIARPRNALGIVGFESQVPSQIDLSNFMKRFRSDATYLPIEIKPINNREGWSEPGLHSSLGTQYPLALTYPTPVIYYQGIPRGIQVQGTPRGIGDRYLEWLNYMINQRPENIPQTISLAYGGTSELTISPDYARAVCRLFGQLGAIGVSILVASGDDGVGRGNCMSYGEIHFYAGFPATCPLVTSVGGTTGGMTSDESEVANGISGGGFSAYFARRDYQAGTLTAFFKKPDNRYPEYSGFFSPYGRGVPDIALQSFNYEVILNRERHMINSTSCATHTAAAIFSQLNDYLIANNRRPLGFLNYWLYDPVVQSLAFNDITSGNNPGCGTEGFYAVEGWDPVTGIGSPDFRALQSLLRVKHGLGPVQVPVPVPTPEPVPQKP